MDLRHFVVLGMLVGEIPPFRLERRDFHVEAIFQLFPDVIMLFPERLETDEGAELSD